MTTKQRSDVFPPGPLRNEHIRIERFLLARDGGIEVFWAPFDHLTRQASVVLVGIAPGATQMRDASAAARDALNRGLTVQTAARRAKTHASFSGSMRDVLVQWLDGIGLARRLDLSTSVELWSPANRLAHFTSALRYPVFNDGERYSGSPSMLNRPVLRSYVDEVFLPELKSVRSDVVIGLGLAVKRVLGYATAQGAIDEGRVLFDLPHPATGPGFPDREETYRRNRRALPTQVRKLLVVSRTPS